MNKKIWNVNNMVHIAMIATLYVVMTLAFAPFSYAGFQFRISEVLVLLCFYDPKYCISLILGCFIANIFSPGIVIFDLIFGTLHTAVSVFFISKCKKNLAIASLYPTIFSFIVGIGISLSYGMPYFLSTAQVMLGEIVVVLGIGYPLFKTLEKNKGFMKFANLNKRSEDSFISSIGYASILLMVIILLLSFTLNVYQDIALFDLATSYPYIYGLFTLEVLSIVMSIFSKNKVMKIIKLIVDISCLIYFVVICILISIFSLNSMIYLVILFMILLTSILNLNN